MAYKGVSTQLPLIKIISILILQLTLFILLLSSLPLAEKMHPLFSASHQSKIFSPAFSFVIIFHFSLMSMPIIYIEEIETTLLTLLGRILGFIEGKGR